jgi:hypothetical protein
MANSLEKRRAWEDRQARPTDEFGRRLGATATALGLVGCRVIFEHPPLDTEFLTLHDGPSIVEPGIPWRMPFTRLRLTRLGSMFI